MNIVRSRRKTLAVQVGRNAEVTVRAPYGVSEKVIGAFVYKNRAWIENKVRLKRQYIETHPEPTDEEIEIKKEAVKKIIPPIVDAYSKRMNLYPSSVKISSARRRYGSCSAKNSLNFSCMLADCPIEAIEYIVVHELAHIAHKNHGKDFYALVSRYMPDYKARRALLKSAEV